MTIFKCDRCGKHIVDTPCYKMKIARQNFNPSNPGAQSGHEEWFDLCEECYKGFANVIKEFTKSKE